MPLGKLTDQDIETIMQTVKIQDQKAHFLNYILMAALSNWSR